RGLVERALGDHHQLVRAHGPSCGRWWPPRSARAPHDACDPLGAGRCRRRERATRPSLPSPPHRVDPPLAPYPAPATRSPATPARAVDRASARLAGGRRLLGGLGRRLGAAFERRRLLALDLARDARDGVDL